MNDLPFRILQNKDLLNDIKKVTCSFDEDDRIVACAVDGKDRMYKGAFVTNRTLFSNMVGYYSRGITQEEAMNMQDYEIVKLYTIPLFVYNVMEQDIFSAKHLTKGIIKTMENNLNYLRIKTLSKPKIKNAGRCNVRDILLSKSGKDKYIEEIINGSTGTTHSIETKLWVIDNNNPPVLYIQIAQQYIRLYSLYNYGIQDISDDDFANLFSNSMDIYKNIIVNDEYVIETGNDRDYIVDINDNAIKDINSMIVRLMLDVEKK